VHAAFRYLLRRGPEGRLRGGHLAEWQPDPASCRGVRIRAGTERPAGSPRLQEEAISFAGPLGVVLGGGS